MNLNVAREVVRVIRAENDRRLSPQESEEPEDAYNRWLCRDEPFINDMCLMLLVALHHELERQLVFLSARVTEPPGQDIPKELWHQNIAAEHRRLRKRGGWKRLAQRLKLDNREEWTSSIETLRLLANFYKHEPFLKPNGNRKEHLKLLEHLRLDAGKNYAPLPQSRCFQEGLATYLGLQTDADYCDIADQLIGRVERLVADLPKDIELRRITGGGSGRAGARLSNFEC
jgi:hypothetical protein